MRMINLCILCLLLIPIVYSENIDIYSIKMYTKGIAGEDIKINGVDEEGGDMKLAPNDVIKIEVKVENLDTTQEIRKFRFKILAQDLDDGSDWKESSDYITIDSEESELVSLQVAIPPLAEEDDYTLKLNMYWTWQNGTTGEKVVDYELEIDDKVQTSSTGTPTYINTQDLLLNMTYSCNKYYSELDKWYKNNADILTKASNLTYDTIQCQSNQRLRELAETDKIYWQTEYNNCIGDNNRTMNQVTVLNEEIQTKQREIEQLEIKNAGMKTEEKCKEEVNQAINLSKPDIVHYLGWILSAIMVIYWYTQIYTKQKKKAPEEDSMLEDV